MVKIFHLEVLLIIDPTPYIVSFYAIFPFPSNPFVSGRPEPQPVRLRRRSTSDRDGTGAIPLRSAERQHNRVGVSNLKGGPRQRHVGLARKKRATWAPSLAAAR